MPRQRSITLTVYLLKEGFRRPEDVLIEKADLTEYAVRIGRQRLGSLFLKQPVQHPPAWLSLFDGVLGRCPELR